MAKDSEKNNDLAVAQTPETQQEQVDQQDNKQQVRLRVDERNMSSEYANAFRTNGTAEEIMVDFGVNVANPDAQQSGQPADITFKISNRLIMNYYSAKRVAIMLSQLVRRHEDQFGELEMDVAKRSKTAIKAGDADASSPAKHLV